MALREEAAAQQRRQVQERQELYASFALKKHAFAIARREANKRGFGPGAGKYLQSSPV